MKCWTETFQTFRFSCVSIRSLIIRRVFSHSFTYSFIHQQLNSLLYGLGRFFNSLIQYIVCRTPWTGDQPGVRPLSTQRNTNIEQSHTDIHGSSGIRTHDISVRASDRSAAAIGIHIRVVCLCEMQDMLISIHTTHKAMSLAQEFGIHTIYTLQMQAQRLLILCWETCRRRLLLDIR
jgi:hypothetical protein